MVGERLLPVSQPMPDPSELPDHGFPWVQQWAVNLKCLDGADAGVEVIYKPTTVGGVQAIVGLVEEVRDRLNGKMHGGKVSPIVHLGKYDYSSAQYGKIWAPLLDVLTWMSLDGPAPAPSPGGSGPPPSPPPSAAAAAEQPRRRRVAKPRCLHPPTLFSLISRLAAAGSISRPSEPLPMRRARRRSYAPSRSAKGRRRYGTPRAPFSTGMTPRRRSSAASMTERCWRRGTPAFDSTIWNYATLGFPFLEPERVIDPMIQAGVSNLPTDLEGAARTLGCGGKQADGKKLIRLFSIAGAAPADHPEEWRRFLDYAQRDVEAMREVYRRTRPLPLAEWRQYWAFERINRRGVHVDTPFVERAAALAAEDAAAIGRRLAELTDGAVTTVNQAKRIAAWLHDQLPDAAMREALTIGAPADEDEGDEAEELEFSLTRDRVARVLAMLEAKRANGGLRPDETKAFEAATLRLYGAGASPKKFARIAREQIGGVIRDQYRFAGAGQTGRMSGKGIQLQNLTRDTVGDVEAALVDAIADGCAHAQLAAADPGDMPATRKLALLVRPALIAGPGKVFVW